MANLELCPLSSYDLCLAPESTDIHFVKLTDSLYKALEDYHLARPLHQNKGSLVLTTSKQGKGGCIEINTDRDRKKYKFSRISFPKNNGLDCLSQKHSSSGLTIIGTAPDKLTVHAKEDVYQNTKEKMILAEDKRQENQTQMIELKNKQRPVNKAPIRRTEDMNSYKNTCNRSVLNFKSAPSVIVADNKTQRSLRERAIHVLALRPHRKPELLNKLSDGKGKSKDFVTKVLAQVSHTQNNMFHLKQFLYNEVQIDTWPDYSDSDRDNVRQQLKLLNMDGGAKRTRGASSSSDSSAFDEPIPEKKDTPKLPTVTEKVVPALPMAEKFAQSKPNFNMENQSFASSSSSSSNTNKQFVPGTKPGGPSSKQHFVPAAKQAGPSATRTEDNSTKARYSGEPSKCSDQAKEPIPAAPRHHLTSQLSKESRKRTLGEPSKSNKKLCTAGSNTQEIVRKAESKRRICQQFKLPFAEQLECNLRSLQQKFTTITCVEQQQRYLEEFNKEYNEYVEIKKSELQSCAEFTETEKKISLCTKGSAEYRKLEKKARETFNKHKNDPKWLQNKEQVLLLEGKLGTIKLLLEEYEGNRVV